MTHISHESLVAVVKQRFPQRQREEYFAFRRQERERIASQRWKEAAANLRASRTHSVFTTVTWEDPEWILACAQKIAEIEARLQRRVDFLCGDAPCSDS